MTLHELYGWLGGALFAICAIPQAWLCFRQGHAKGTSWLFLLLWLFGEVFTILYVWPKQDWPLLLNYFTNVLLLLVIIRYKLWPRVERTEPTAFLATQA